MSKRLLSQQSDYIAAQSNYERARKRHTTLKKRGTATEQELEASAESLARYKAKLELTVAALKSVGLSKTSM